MRDIDAIKHLYKEKTGEYYKHMQDYRESFQLASEALSDLAALDKVISGDESFFNIEVIDRLQDGITH